MSLRDRLYRFALTCFLGVGHAYEQIPGDGTRIRELWRPLAAVLWALGVREEEMGSVYKFFLEATGTTKHEPTDWELALLEFLKIRAGEETTTFEMSAGEILEGLDLGENGPKQKWVGEALSRFHIPLGLRPKKT